MDLLLRVIDGPSDGSWHGMQARFDASGGLIGRAETARLSLPDASRTVSRFHAHVSCNGDTFYLEEMGSRNAAMINGRALKTGVKEALRPGDQVQIGHFTLAVDFDDPDFPATQVIDRRTVDLAAGESDNATRIAVRAALLPRSSSSTADLLAAFLDAAGVQLEMREGLRPEFMGMLGSMLRALVGGIHRLASQRMRFRDEPSAAKADPKARHIDPIRTAAEETRLLTSLLDPGPPGSDPPHVRVQEMVDELAARMAAMHAAVDAAVEQTEASLAPPALEERLEPSLFLDELLPMRRRARLWELYQQTYAGAADDKGDSKGDSRGSGVRKVFNHAFTRVYEAEVSRLRRRPATRA